MKHNTQSKSSISSTFETSSCASNALQIKGNIRFGERFLLKEKKPIDVGGFGEVWIAEDLLLNNKKIALKISWKEDLVDETLFLRQLSKERYVSIFDYVKDNTLNASAYAMELLTSPWVTLEQYYTDKLEGMFDNGKYVLALKQVFIIAIDLLISLQELHGTKYKKTKRFCHADIKPKNLFVHSKKIQAIVKQHWGESFAPITKICDLGLATKSKILHGGTSTYMSPEQELASDIKVSPASDIFSMAQTITDIITGFTLHDDVSHIAKIKTTFSDLIPSAYLAERLTKLIREMTFKTPAKRPSAIKTKENLQKIVAYNDDWLILSIFADPKNSYTIAEAADMLFYELAPSRNWKRRKEHRVDEMKAILQNAYKRKILARDGHNYSIRTK